MATVEKPVIVIGIDGSDGSDDSDDSFYALQWTLDHYFKRSAPQSRLVIVHAKPTPSSAVPDADLRRRAARVLKKAKKICSAKSVNDVAVKVVEGDAGKVLCEAVQEHRASILVLGSRCDGAIGGYALGSVGDYCARDCARHAHCTVMIVNEQNQPLRLLLPLNTE